jgi:F-type H+-transporting ATPase subunit epsilon
MTEGTTRHLAASRGFAEVVSNKVTFLLEAAEFAEEIDVERARRAKERAESVMRDLSSDNKDFNVWELALKRAIARISTASKM